MEAFVASLGHLDCRPRARAAASRRFVCCMSVGRGDTVTILDYGAGNVRSLQNAVRALGYGIKWVQTADDILSAERLIFPGVGSFGASMINLREKEFAEPLAQYLREDRPFLGICLGLQTLFESSEESPDLPGLTLLNGVVKRFDVADKNLSVPHMGWNTLQLRKRSPLLSGVENERFYFVHSYRLGSEHGEYALSTTDHGESFVSVLQRGYLCATQFHPEKSGAAGLRLIDNFISASNVSNISALRPAVIQGATDVAKGLSKRVIACLDVRENDQGDLVVTKGDQYDVREKAGRKVRNLGKPVELAKRYFEDGADEITFLNITSFRSEPLGDAPMLEVLERSSETVFVPLCIGGGIRDYTDKDGVFYSSLDVAARYFRAGADKVSIGSDAVYAAERYWANNALRDGTSSIESISFVYGAQAVVVSVDPRRVYVQRPEDTLHTAVRVPNEKRGPAGEEYAWYQCTVKGGREGRDIDVIELVVAVEALGAGEILLNSMDADGSNAGYDLDLIRTVSSAVSIPVIASSGAGRPAHFVECFQRTRVEAALAAGIFHRREVSIEEVKEELAANNVPVRFSRVPLSLVNASF